MTHPNPHTHPWDSATLNRRVAATGKRHAAGSPSGEELTAYGQAMAHGSPNGTALVLGMTPELRLLAVQHFAHVISMDRNADAIALYADWLPPETRAREQIIEKDWLAGLADLTETPACILADGVLPNLPPQAQLALLQLLRQCVATDGLFVTRQPVIPPEMETGRDEWPALVASFRRREFCENALGLGLRITGFLHSCWRPQDGRLDNAQVFANLDALLAAKELHPEEHAAADRFRFAGPNWIFRQTEWEAQLNATGWRGRRHALCERHWHGYYQVHVCTPNP